jgi:hypothetical protein
VAGELLARRASTPFLQYNSGYACDVRTGETRGWPARSSPFYCGVHGAELRGRRTWSAPNHTTVRPRATVLGPGRFVVILHDGNTSSSIRMGRGRLAPGPRREVLNRFGLGVARTLRALLTGAPWAGAWEHRAEAITRRWAGEHAAHAAVSPAATSLETAALFGFLLEASAPRRVLVIGSPFGAVVATAYATGHGDVVCDVDPSAPRGRYDLALIDLAGDPARTARLGPLLRVLSPSGMGLVAGGDGAACGRRLRRALAHCCADVYPEVEEITRDAAGRRAMLVGRVIGSTG